MADLSITGTSVYPNVSSPTANFTKKTIQLGEAVTGGMPLYKKSSDGKYYKAIANDTAEKAGSGDLVIAGSAGSTSQFITGLGPGQIHIGASGAVGVFYVVSAANAGGIAPISDLASGNQVNVLGQVISTGILNFNPALGTALA